MAFNTEFMVSMTCESCVNDISSILNNISGIESFNVDLDTKTVHVHGTASPALMAQKLQATGRAAIVRGLGDPDRAAVCILEKHGKLQPTMDVFGLVRLVEVSPDLTLCDLTLRGVPAGHYVAKVHATGDLTAGIASLGPSWTTEPLGVLDVDESGSGQILLEVRELPIYEIVGRAISVAAVDHEHDGIIGVIARSAGTWENTKWVCTCSGQNVWDERQEMLQIGSTL